MLSHREKASCVQSRKKPCGYADMRMDIATSPVNKGHVSVYGVVNGCADGLFFYVDEVFFYVDG